MPAQRLIRPVGQPAAASDAPDGRKLYQQVAAAVAEAIQRGEFGPGQRIPSERELAEEYKVSRPTIREAMIALEVIGVVRSRHGSGSSRSDGARPSCSGHPNKPSWEHAAR